MPNEVLFAKRFGCDTFRKESELHAKMQYSLGKELCNNALAGPEEIAEAIAQRQTPVMLWTDLNTNDWHRADGMGGFIRFWQNWPDTQGRLLLVCVSFCYQEEKMSFWQHWFSKPKTDINDTIQEAFSSLSFQDLNVPGVVLPRLCPIKKRHVEHWARDHVCEFCDITLLLDKINRLFENETDTFPMKHQLKKSCFSCLSGRKEGEITTFFELFQAFRQQCFTHDGVCRAGSQGPVVLNSRMLFLLY